MGAFTCRCGCVLGDANDISHDYLLIGMADAETLLSPGAGSTPRNGQVLESLASASDVVFECPNCSRIAREGSDGITFYRRDDELPRIWADFTHRDALGRVLLTHERSLTQLREQKVLLRPALNVTLWGGGTETPGVVELAVGPDDTLLDGVWSVDIEGPPAGD